jgi:hypothetical protein
MASELIVQTLKGPTSGANANKVIIPSGQTLDASAGGMTTPAGHVIQVVDFKTGAQTATSSSTPVKTNLFKSITPSSTNSKILVTVCFTADNSNVARQISSTIYRDSTNLADNASQDRMGANYYEGDRGIGEVTLVYLDSPSTTDSIEYALYVWEPGGSGEIVACGQGSINTITLMEIAG